MDVSEQSKLSLTEAYYATQRWLDHIGLTTVEINEPADGVVELRSATHITRIRITPSQIGQGAVLALLRAAEEIDLAPVLFSASGFSTGAIGFAVTQAVALFDLGIDGSIVPVTGPARSMVSPESLEPAFAKPIEVAEPAQPVSYFEAPERDKKPDTESKDKQSLGGTETWPNCPQCNATCHPSSQRCPLCGYDLTSPLPSDQTPSSTPASPRQPQPGTVPVLQCGSCGSFDINLLKP